MELHRPSRPLAPFVSHYWITRDNTDTAHEVLPDGCVDVVFTIGAHAGTQAFGAATHRGACPLLPGHHYLGICFRPGQFRHFLTLPAHYLTDSGLAVSGVAGLAADGLGDGLACGRALAQIDGALSAWLARKTVATDRVDRALAIIDRTFGGIRIAALASDLGLSRRQLERQFLEYVGVTPKTYAGIQRCRRAWSLLQDRSDVSLAEIALSAGYADQSHMNREFQHRLGQSPRSVLDVAFVQDRLISRG